MMTPAHYLALKALLRIRCFKRNIMLVQINQLVKYSHPGIVIVFAHQDPLLQVKASDDNF